MHKILRSIKSFKGSRFANKLPTYLERLQQQEEMDRKTNLDVLRREVFNDSIQLPIKFAAYYITNQQTFWAELTRSMIDASNHLILFATNYINYGPNKQFPYGIEKVKHLVALIPSALFLYFGASISYESFLNIYNYGHYVGEIHGNAWGLALYLLSIGIETSVVFKNIRDAQAVDSNNETKTGLFKQFLSVFQKKDPVLQAILYENAITLGSTLIPLLSSAFTLIYPTHAFEIVGSLGIGLIQLQLAYHLSAQNLSSLMGEQSISDLEVKKILEIIKQNQYVEKIQNEKAVMLGSRKFRFSAEITFNIKQINQDTESKYLERFDKVIYSESYRDREEYLQELLREIQEYVLASLHIQIQKIESAIRNEFPNCIHLDFEINNKSLAETYSIDDGNWLFRETLLKSPFKVEKWMLDEVDRLIKKISKKKNETYIETYQSLCSSIQYNQWHDVEDDDESLKIIEDYRFEELQNELKGIDQILQFKNKSKGQ
ncbi:unnamed protein product [Paramecium primaurelia]|uniref:Cation efflux protein transmembrane domain-containing protein n=1 Tax=Paramecium primaurelia TaxID=5886 RepID=A0A8S1NE61_PARPR|nr:unnamed protein product [Paramecium primaurelia]